MRVQIGHGRVDSVFMVHGDNGDMSWAVSVSGGVGLCWFFVLSRKLGMRYGIICSSTK